MGNLTLPSTLRGLGANSPGPGRRMGRAGKIKAPSSSAAAGPGSEGGQVGPTPQRPEMIALDPEQEEWMRLTVRTDHGADAVEGV